MNPYSNNLLFRYIMKRRIFDAKFRRVLLITNDIYLRKGIRESLRLGNNISFSRLERLNDVKAREIDVVLLDLLSWQASEVNKEGSILDYLSKFNAIVIMVTCSDFQEMLTNILYPELLKAGRKDLMPLVNMLCGGTATYKFKSSSRNKVFLTKREFQVINEFIIGCGARYIENKLSINHRTVCSHKLSALRKIGCKNLSHLFMLTRPFMFDLELLLKRNKAK